MFTNKSARWGLLWSNCLELDKCGELGRQKQQINKREKQLGHYRGHGTETDRTEINKKRINVNMDHHSTQSTWL